MAASSRRSDRARLVEYSDMKAKTALFVLLGMGSSFTVILALMVALSQQPASPSRSKRPVASSTVRPAREAGFVAPVEKRKSTTSPETADPEVAVEVEPQPRQTVEKTRPQDEAWKQRQLQFEAILRDIRVERSGLEKQLNALERDRSRMVKELAKELSNSEPDLAAEELDVLDDETAALVLERMENSPRVEVLNLLEPKRARLLRGRIHRL